MKSGLVAMPLFLLDDLLSVIVELWLLRYDSRTGKYRNDFLGTFPKRETVHYIGQTYLNYY